MSEYEIAGHYYAQNFQVHCFWTWLLFGCVEHILMIVIDLLLAFAMVHEHNASAQLASGRGLDQHGLRLLCHILLLCSAVPSGYVCMCV